MERHGGGYATWLFTDAFIKDASIVLISMVYVDMPRDFSRVRLSSPLFAGGSMAPTRVHVRDAYESVVVVVFEHPALAELSRVDVGVAYGDEPGQDLTVLRAPGGWESGFAVCALFLQDRHLLRMWTAYWHLLGVDAFYLYYNGDSGDIPALAALLGDLPASVTFIHWPFDYWVPNTERPHHGQPLAWNSCYQRNKDRHDFLAFYDLDELLVFPNHTDLSSFYRSIPRPWVAMRSQSAWARVDLEGINVTFDALELHHIAAAPLLRAPIHYSREKYVLNTTSGASIINVHGVYETPTGLGFPGQPVKDGLPWPEPQLLMDPTVAYQFHFVNVGRDRARDKNLGQPTVLDSRAAETIAAQLDTPRGRRWQSLQGVGGAARTLSKPAFGKGEGGTAKFTPGGAR